MTEQKTFCRICDVCCGLIASVDDGRIVKLRPNPDHVVSRGYACPKGLAYKEIVHSRDRVTAPLKRIGAVSDPDAWVSTTWDDALGEVGDRLRTIIEEDGPDAVALYVGNGAGFGFLHPFWAQGFLMGIGSKSLYGSATQDCSNKFAVSARMYGFPMIQPVPDFENADCFILFGANPAATKLSFRGVPDPMRAFQTASDRGCRIVHVNPRRVEAVDAGGEHLPIRPDTDVFLLSAFVRELFRTGGIDRERAAPFMKGLEDFEAAVAPWTPEKQAEVTGVSADALRNLVRSYREADGASLYLSTGLNMGRNGALCCWLVEAINAASGNLDRRGGTLVGAGSLMDFPKWGSKAGAMMGDHPSRLGSFRTVNELFPGAMLADEILTPGKGRVRALLVAAGNPLLTLPDTAKTERALRSLDLLVTVDIFRSATGDFADFVLPGVTPYEHPDIGYLFHSMMGIGHRRFLQYTDKVVEPVGDSRDELWIWRELCRAAGGKFYGSAAIQGWINLRRRLTALPGIGKRFAFSHERILHRFLRLFRRPGIRKMRKKPDGLLMPEIPPGSFLGRRVRTGDGKVDLAPPPMIEAMGKLAAEFTWEMEHRDDLKLVNMRGFRTHNSYMQSASSLMRGENGTNHLRIHPRDAANRSLTDGGEALVWNDTGCIRIPVKVSEEMTPGAVAIPFGWGQQRSRGLTDAARTGGANVNWLFPSGSDHIDSLSLMAHLSGVVVAARPVPEGIPAVILAGGGSRRFGSNKAFAVWRGKGMIEHVIETASAVTDDLFLSVRDPAAYRELGYPCIVDPDPDITTPLNGLLAAARVLPGPFLVLTADAPAVKPAVIRLLLDSYRGAADGRAGPVLVGDQERIYPFPGLYRPEGLDRFEAARDAKRYRLSELVTEWDPIVVPVDAVRRVDPELDSLKNVNTREELAAIG